MSKIVLGISLLTNLVLGFLVVKNQPKNQNLFHVERVIDGDTFVIDNNQQIRLMSVNAPEVDLCGGQEAKQKLESLLIGKKVKLNAQINDHFGRLLALVYVGNNLVNEEMISSGWARFTSTQSDESETLKAAFQKAKTDMVGIFSAKCFQDINPVNSKCNIKGNVREGNKTYFFPGCGNYSNVQVELDQGDQWFCSEKEAIAAGFIKGVNCYTKTY